jgi:transposase
MFPGNTNDSTTLPAVMADLQKRFGVGRIALVADRGLISEANLNEVETAGFDHVLATRLHRDNDVTAVLTAAAEPDTVWVGAGKDRTACEIVLDGRRHVVIDSPARRRRDDHRREEFLARTENELVPLTARVENTKKFSDPAKIGAAAERILTRSPVRSCFVTTIGVGTFTWRHDKTAIDYEQRLLAGRYVLTTSLTPAQASTGEIVAHYQSLANVEHRFRVMKDSSGCVPSTTGPKTASAATSRSVCSTP